MVVCFAAPLAPVGSLGSQGSACYGSALLVSAGFPGVLLSPIELLVAPFVQVYSLGS